MSKFIIENRTDLSNLQVLKLVSTVIERGRISNNNKQYCYLTVFHVGSGEYKVSTDLNKNSDRFVITHRLK